MGFKRLWLSLLGLSSEYRGFRLSSTYLMIVLKIIVTDSMESRLTRLPIPRQAALPPEEGYITR
jgi:hypothetical protein